MPPTQLACPACTTLLRLMPDLIGQPTRCPKCKTVFQTVPGPGRTADPLPVAVPPADPGPPSAPDLPTTPAPAATSTADKDRAFFEWLAEAKDPLAKPPDPPPVSAAAPPPLLEAELLPLEDDPPPPRKSSRPGPRPGAKPAAPAPGRPLDEEGARQPRNGLALAAVAAAGVLFLSGLAATGYLAYSLWGGDPGPEAGENAGTPPSPREAGPAVEMAGGPLSPAVLARAKAATVAVTAQGPAGALAPASGFFVPGPGLVVTAGRAVGQGRAPVAVSKIQVLLGAATAEPRTLAARVVGADPDLDLAVLQVVGLDLPEPLSFADTLTVKEAHPVFVFAVPSAAGPKAVTVGGTFVAGLRTAAGPRPWFLLGNGTPTGAAGGPVTDATGRVVGVTGTVPGTLAAAAVPAETVQSFVRSAVKSAEAGAPAAVAPPGHAEAEPKPRADPPPEEDTPPPFPNPRRRGPRPPRFDMPGFPPPGWAPPGFPPAFPPEGADPSVFRPAAPALPRGR